MRACWLKWVGRDWSISADYIWLNYSDANIPTVPSTGETTARGRLARSRAVRLGAETRYPFKVLAGAENQPTKTKAFAHSDREKTRPRVIS